MLTKQETRAIAERMRIASQEELGDQYKVTYKSGSYGDTLSLKFEVAKADATGTIQTQAMIDFVNMATQWGLVPEDLGAGVRFGAKWYKIIGLKPRAWKRPIILSELMGKGRVVTSADSVKLAKEAGPGSWTPAS